MSQSSRPTAVVTGGAGFIGSHTVDLLVEEGYNVRIIDNLTGGREINLSQHKLNPDVKLDTRDIRLIASNDSVFKDAQIVIHFAGIGDIVPSIDRPIDYMSTNVLGTIHALEGARHNYAKRFVYAASSSCYGLAQELPTTEDAPIQPQYPYALSKYQGEQAVFHWRKVYKLPVNSIRIFNAYGLRSRTTGAYGAVFGVFLKQKLSGKPLTVVGDGTQTRDFVYVTDVAKAFYLAATHKVEGEIFNMGSNNPQSVNLLVELLKAEGVIHLPKRPGEPDCTWADTTKITKMLGWKPIVTFQEGISKMVDRIDDWKDAPLWDIESINLATKGWFEHLGDT